MKLSFLEPARADLRRAYSYYEAARPSLGRAFIRELRASLDRIQRFPNAWQPLGSRYRRCRIKRFPYGLIYRVEDDSMVIVAVAHLHQEPGHWHWRVEDPPV